MILKYIEIDKDRAGGKPVIARTRITVAQVLAELSEGYSIKEFSDDMNISYEHLQGAMEELSALFNVKFNAYFKDQLCLMPIDKITMEEF